MTNLTKYVRGRAGAICVLTLLVLFGIVGCGDYGQYLESENHEDCLAYYQHLFDGKGNPKLSWSGDCVNGLAHGEGILAVSDDFGRWKKWKGTYVNGLMEGRWFMLDSEGGDSGQGSYENGKLVGIFDYDFNPKPYLEAIAGGLTLGASLAIQQQRQDAIIQQQKQQEAAQRAAEAQRRAEQARAQQQQYEQQAAAQQQADEYERQQREAERQAEQQRQEAERQQQEAQKLAAKQAKAAQRQACINQIVGPRTQCVHVGDWIGGSAGYRLHNKCGEPISVYYGYTTSGAAKGSADRSSLTTLRPYGSSPTSWSTDERRKIQYHACYDSPGLDKNCNALSWACVNGDPG